MKNRTIFTGDNLPVLRGINTAAVDLVYLDPPFNSKKPWSAPIGSKAAGAHFKDTWTLSDIDQRDHDLLRNTNPKLHDVVLAGAAAGGASTMSYLMYMTPRLLELRRVLKPTGSLYLHCDPTESHSLKLVLDVIFGRRNFRSEIVWKRTRGRSNANRWGNIHDIILYYAGEGRIWNPVYSTHSEEYLDKTYRNEDERGRFRLGDLTAPGHSKGNNVTWRGINPVERTGRGWCPPTGGRTSEWIRDNVIPGWPDGYQSTVEKLDALDDNGLVYWPKSGGVPRLKGYLDASPGVAVEDVIMDLPPVGGQAKEKVGYPTQKPKALLDRIIAASSNEGDLVLDPFAGCATTAVAAEDAGRRWWGIDLSAKAAELIKYRLQEHLGLFYDINHRTDLPHRTDLGPLPKPETFRTELYGEQEGDCNGCGTHFERKVDFHIDHIVPKAAGGTDHRTNLQLLCGNCNLRKGSGSMSKLMTKLLKERGLS